MYVCKHIMTYVCTCRSQRFQGGPGRLVQGGQGRVLCWELDELALGPGGDAHGHQAHGVVDQGDARLAGMLLRAGSLSVCLSLSLSLSLSLPPSLEYTNQYIRNFTYTYIYICICICVYLYL